MTKVIDVIIINGIKTNFYTYYLLLKLKVKTPEAIWSKYSIDLLCAQLCLTLCDPIEYGLPGSSVHGFPWQEYWNELPCPPPRDLPDRGITSPVLVGGFFTTNTTCEALDLL